ncbi:MAG: hypothetical protein GXY88_00410 [Tissierellia bacterium]|nr:hypothetical protein [Tissierellia bacterium]
MVSNLLNNIWTNSFTYKILRVIKKACINGLNNSLIISTLLRDENIYGRSGLLIGLVERLLKFINWIRGLLCKPISNSLLINLAKYTVTTIFSDIYRFIFTSIGTGIMVFGILSFVQGIYSIKRTLFIVLMGILPFILGWLNVDMDKLVKNSKFARIIMEIFDYDS